MIETTPEWQAVKVWNGTDRVRLGPAASRQWLHDPKHLMFVLARYKHAARLIGGAQTVLEIGCGEGIGARMLAEGRRLWHGIDSDAPSLDEGCAALPAPLYRIDYADALSFQARGYDAVVSLDVIEHIPAEQEEAFMATAIHALAPGGVCVIGTPNETARAYQSEGSRIGHVNLYGHERLRQLMERHFGVVQMFSMHDEILGTSHLGMAHYLLAVGIGPR